MKSTSVLFVLGSLSAILIIGLRVRVAPLAPIFFLQAGSGAIMPRNKLRQYVLSYQDLLAKASRARTYHDLGWDSQVEIPPTASTLRPKNSLFPWCIGRARMEFTMLERPSHARSTYASKLLISPWLNFSTPPQFSTEEMLPSLDNAEPADLCCIYQPVGFDVSAGWLSVAKIALTLVVGVIAALVSTVWLRFVVFNYAHPSP